MKITNNYSLLNLVLFTLLLFLVACNQDTDVNQKTAIDATSNVTANNNNALTKLLVSQPFTNVSQIPETLTITNPSKPKSYKLDTGTEINVPANAFVYADGQPVEGAVDLKFTEIHSAAEIIASGIPMVFIDENGKEQQMQSAGMFEIQGMQKNQPIQIAEGKSIDVDLQSDVEGAYDFWSFDEEKGNWINEGPIAAKEGPKENITPPAVQNKIRQLKKRTKNKPVKPTFSEANNLVFNDLDLKYCPELKSQKPVVLNYIGTDKSKSPTENKWIRKPGIWHKKTIKPVAGEKGNYELTLLGDKMYQIKVKPAPTALDIDKANAAYQKELAAYKADVKLLAQSESLRQNRVSFRRMAAIRNFGRYNCDILWKIKNPIKFKAGFAIEDVSQMVANDAKFYMVTGEDRVVLRLNKRVLDDFRFDPKIDNKIMAILPDNTTALFSEADFKEQEAEMAQSNGSDFTFSMDRSEDKIESIEDLSDFLNETVSAKTDPIQNLKLFPNPAKDQVTVSFEMEGATDAPIMIFDAKGQQVASRNISAQIGENTEQFDISNLPSGNYVVRVSTNNAMVTEQLSIVKN